jgi:hypothetical protein
VHIRPVCEWFAHGFVPGPGCGLVCSVLSSRARACRRNRQVPRVPLPDVGVTFIRETCTASSEDITPRSSLLRTHAPIPCGSPLLRFVASFEESVQVATRPCCHRDLPDVIPESLSCDAWASATTVCRLLLPVASSASSAFPNGEWVGLPFLSAKATSQRGTFRRLQPFLDVQASQFACHSGRSYHNSFLQGS